MRARGGEIGGQGDGPVHARTERARYRVGRLRGRKQHGFEPHPVQAENSAGHQPADGVIAEEARDEADLDAPVRPRRVHMGRAEQQARAGAGVKPREALL